MFFANSRYASLATYQFTPAGGGTVQLIKLPTPRLQAVLGYYRRGQGDRLDQIAGRYLSDATQFWRLCDSNGAVVPDALAAHDLVGIPIDASS